MRTPKAWGWVCALVALAILFIGSAAWGQTGAASIEGDVVDARGGVVVGAKVTITNVATSVSRTMQTDSTGHYEFYGLAPGQYTLRVEMAGFRVAVREKLDLLVNMTSRLNVALEVGALTETVVVSEAAAPLNTHDASLGNVISMSQIGQLPLEARNVVVLLSLQPGATFLPTGDMRSGSISGSRSDQSNVTLDGVDINDPQGQTEAYSASVRVPADSLQEFRVITSTYDATQGRSSAGQVALVSRGGSNTFHGSAHWFHRNTATSSNEYFNKLSQLGASRPNKAPLLQKHIYGGAAGGPIWKDRLFFYGNYEGLSESRQTVVQRSVPSETFRDGIIIYRCGTASQCPAGSVTGLSGRSYPVSAGFHGLSPSEFAAIDPLGIGPDLAATNYWSQFPLPNDPGRDGRNIMGFRFAAPIKNKFNVGTAKFDYKFDRAGNHTLFWRGSYQHDRINSEPQFPGGPPNTARLIQPKLSIVGYDAVLGPRLVNNFRWGFVHYNLTQGGLQTTSVSTFRFLDTFEGITSTSARLFTTQNFVDDISWTRGTHTFQFGANIRFSRLPRFTNGNSFHSAIANGSWLTGVGRRYMPGRATCTTPGCSQVPAVSSSDAAVWADSSIDLWGLLTQGNARYNYTRTGTSLSLGEPVRRKYASNEYEMYVQDTWRFRPSLTLTFGVRYSLYSPPWEVNGNQVAPGPSLGDYYDLRQRGMLAGIPSNQLPRVTFDLAGSANGKKGFYNWDWNNFAPRASFAWNPHFSSGFLGWLTGNGKMVVRGGYSLVHDRIGQALATTFDSSGSFGMSTVLVTPFGSVTESTAPRWTAINTVPGMPLLLPAPPGGFPATPQQGLFAITNAIDNTIRTPYSSMYDLVIGREFPGNLVAEFAYVGRRGKWLLTKWDLSMPLNLVDSQSGMDYFTAASQLAALAEVGDPTGFSAGTPVAGVPTIQYWENMYPGMIGNPLCDVQGLGAAAYNTATKAVYDVYLCVAPDYTTALQLLDQGGLCDTAVNADTNAPFNACSKFGPYAYFQDQFSALAGQSSMGYSNYDSFQLTIRKRMSHGLQFDFNYTLGKSLDLTSDVERGGSFGSFFPGGYTEFVVNSWTPKLSYGHSTYDITHQMNLNWVYELPFGHNRWLGKGVPAWLNHVIGDWNVAGLWRWTGGLPFSVINCRSCWPTNWNLQGNASLFGNTFPEQKTTKNAVGGRPSMFADSKAALAAFRRDRPGEVGFRNAMRGDGFFTIDTAVIKSWKLYESHKLAFRWEVFNLTNTPRFDTGDITVLPDISSTFGRYNSTLAICDRAAGRCMQFGLRYEF